MQTQTCRKCSPLGLRKSFGYGDRLGLVTPGHLAANRQSDFAPVFAQQSARKLTRTSRQEWEEVYLNQRAGRQLLHVTFGSVLTEGQAAKGSTFKERILQTLQENADLHHELIERHFVRHLHGLSGG